MIPESMDRTVQIESRKYEIRRPLLARGHQAGKQGVSNHWSLILLFSIFNQQLINLYQCFHDQSAIDQSAVDKSAVCWSTGQQTGVWQSRGQQAGDIDLLLDALDQQFTLQHPGSLNLGWSRKSMKFQGISNTPKITKLVSQDLQKCPKWGPNWCLKSSNSRKK